MHDQSKNRCLRDDDQPLKRFMFLPVWTVSVSLLKSFYLVGLLIDYQTPSDY